MSEAVTNRSGLYISEETAYAEVPATPAMTELPFTGENIKHNKQTDVSAEINDTRNVEDLAEVGVNVNGGINFELQFGAYDSLFKSAFAAAFVSAATAAACDISLSAQTITKNATTWSATERLAKLVKISGATNAANNGIKRVVSWSATVITLAAGSLTANETASSLTITTKYIRNGSTLLSLLLEKKFTDIAQFISYRGNVVNQFNLSCVAKQKVTGSFQLNGERGVPSATTVSGSLVAKANAPIIRAGANVGSILVNGTALTTGVKEIDLTLVNSLRARDVVTSKYARSQGFGNFDVTGRVQAYFEDLTLLNNYYNHDSLSFYSDFTDDSGSKIGFFLPKIKLTEGDPERGGQNEDIMLPLAFRGLADTVGSAAYSAQMDYLVLP